MKTTKITIALLSALALTALTIPAQAQTNKKTTKAPVKKAAKAAAPKKPAAKKVAANTKRKNKTPAPLAAGLPALTAIQTQLASHVQTGQIACGLGAKVNISADTKNAGYFNVTMGREKYLMHPVETTTGAMRLEDKKTGAVWLQLANKSMLMNQKRGQRLADDCTTPEQKAVAQNMAGQKPALISHPSAMNIPANNIPANNVPAAKPNTTTIEKLTPEEQAKKLLN